ncbi:MAG: hypothetical protein AMXMBFR12_03920 [Candidatus Babeliales bacterium]
MNGNIIFLISLAHLSVSSMENPGQQLLPEYKLIFVKNFLTEQFKASYEQTTLVERNRYKCHGIKIPIYTFDCANSNNTTLATSCIIKDAYPAIWFGASYDDKALSTDRVFLENGNSYYQAQIVKRANDFAIRSSCRVVGTGVLAILWRDLVFKKTFLTLAQITDMQKDGDIVDLDVNRQLIAE